MSTTHHPRRLRSDEGAALIMALVFITAIALIVTALLTQTTTQLKVTRVVRDHTDKAYAADAGLEHAIEQVRLDRTVCANPAAGEEPLVDVVVDGRTVAVECETIAGGTSGAEGWAVIARSTASNAITTAVGGQERIGGRVFAASLGSNLDLEVKGFLFEQMGVGCPDANSPPPTELVVTPNPPFRYRCVAFPDGPPDPDHALPAAPPAPAPPPTLGACTVFHPGTYTAALPLTAHNFFESGTYYFENLGEIEVTHKTIIGGERSPLETRVNSGSSPCDSLMNAGTGTSTGVKWIFGGSTWLDVINHGNVELFSRQGGAADEGQQKISLHAVTAGEAAGGFVPSTTTQLVNVDTGNTAQLSIHGMVYAPESFIEFFATNQSEAQLRGGVVAWRLHLESSASSTGLIVGLQDTSPPRTTRVTATCCIEAGDTTIDVTAEAVADFDNNQASTLRILSWRSRRTPTPSP